MTTLMPPWTSILKLAVKPMEVKKAIIRRSFSELSNVR